MPRESTRDIVIEVREKIKSVDENLKNHLRSHASRENRLLIITGSLLVGIILKLFIGN